MAAEVYTPIVRTGGSPGSALVWGIRGRRFKSSRSDHLASPESLRDRGRFRAWKKRSWSPRLVFLSLVLSAQSPLLSGIAAIILWGMRHSPIELPSPLSWGVPRRAAELKQAT